MPGLLCDLQRICGNPAGRGSRTAADAVPFVVMRGTKCRSCETRIEGQPSFCARCGVPTPWATAEERTRYDLAKWREHAEQTRANGQTRVPATVSASTDQRAGSIAVSDEAYVA